MASSTDLQLVINAEIPDLALALQTKIEAVDNVTIEYNLLIQFLSDFVVANRETNLELSRIKPSFESIKSQMQASFIFNGGEIQVKVDVNNFYEGKVRCLIDARLESANDIMELFMVTDAIRTFEPKADIELQIPYVPYARQDRVMQEGEALGIVVMARLINAQKYSNIVIWDAHSDVTPALLHNSRNIHPKDLVRPVFTGQASNTYISNENTILVAPDAGSIKKVSAVAKEYSMPMVRADKHRDVKTGQITETIVYSEHVGDKDFLIIDDICDGGRTFIELAAKLREKTTGKIASSSLPL